MFDNRKNRRLLKTKRIETALKEEEVYLQQLDYAKETFKMVENYRAGQDEDDTGWYKHGLHAKDRGELDAGDVENIQNSAYLLYKTNPHARSVVRNVVKFTMGRGVMVDHMDDRPEIAAYWDRFVAANRWNLKQKEITLRLVRDGECFLPKNRIQTKGKSTILLRFLEPFEITPDDLGKPTFGIETDPKDIETPIWYNRRVVKDGVISYEKIDAEDIYHWKINADSTLKRGLPGIEPVMKSIKQYEQWIANRILLHQIRTSVALVKRYKATPEQLSTFRAEDRSTLQTSVGRDKKQKMIEPGTTIHTTEGIDYEFLSPNLDARDAAEDGRAILLSVAAGVGQPEFMVSQDSSNSNYSSSMIAESPGVREFEDYQSIVGFFFQELYRELMLFGLEVGDIPEPVEKYEGDIPPLARATFIFPTMIHRDYLRENEAFAIQQEHRVLSTKTWREKVDLNNDNEELNLENENRELFDFESEIGIRVDEPQSQRKSELLDARDAAEERAISLRNPR